MSEELGERTRHGLSIDASWWILIAVTMLMAVALWMFPWGYWL